MLYFIMASLNAVAEKRAFIVGVGAYDELPDLRKTIGDVEGYNQLFGEELGFEVTQLVNPNQLEFVQAFGSFLGSVEENDEVAFIFSGHGWTDSAENYLVMADAPLVASEFALKSQTVALSTGVLTELKRKNPRVVLGIIDACRENPFEGMTKGLVPKGLVPVQAPEGMLLLFAAGDRQLALDRLSATDESPYSVFTRTLLPLLRETDRPLQEIARDVKDDVRDLALTIRHDQRPAYYDELLGDYCLSGKCVGTTTDEYREFRQYQADLHEQHETATRFLELADQWYAKGSLAGALDRYLAVIKIHEKYNLIPGSDEILYAYVRSLQITLETEIDDGLTLEELTEGYEKEVDNRAKEAGFTDENFEETRKLVHEIPYFSEGFFYTLLAKQRNEGRVNYRQSFCRDDWLSSDLDSQAFGPFHLTEPWLTRAREFRSDVNCNPGHFENEMVIANDFVAAAIESGTEQSLIEAMEYMDYFAALIKTEGEVARPTDLLTPFADLSFLVGDQLLYHSSEISPRRLRRDVDRILSDLLEAGGYSVDHDLSKVVGAEQAFLAALQLEMLEMNEYERRAKVCESEWMDDTDKTRFGHVKLGEPWLSAARHWRESWGCKSD